MPTNLDYENIQLQRQAITADQERTKFRVLGTVGTIVVVVVGSLMGYGCTMSHEYDLKKQANDTAEVQACVKAGSNYMPVQHITKDSNGSHADIQMSCVTPADFPAVSANNANIVRAFAGQ